MKINYFISARSEDQVQGIIVSLSAEFDRKNLPTMVCFNVSGSIETKGEPVYMNANGNYDIEKKLFSLNGSQLPASFLVELETKAMEFFEQIKIDQEA